MDKTTWCIMTLVLLGIGLLIGVSSVQAQTRGSGPQMENTLRVQVQGLDEQATDEVANVSVLRHGGGFRGGAETVLGPQEIPVGETAELGKLEIGPGQTPDLLVETDRTRYVQPITPREVEQGVVTVTVGAGQSEGPIQVETHHQVIQPFPARIMVREMVFLRNESDQPISGDQVRFEIPDGVDQVHVGQGFRGSEDLVRDGNTIGPEMDISPEVTALEWFYAVPAGNETQIGRTLNLPTAELQVRVPEMDGLELDYENLEPGESPDSGQQNMTLLEARDLSEGSTYALTLSGLDDLDMSGMGPMANQGGDAPSDGASGPPGGGPSGPSGEPPQADWHPGQQGGQDTGGLNWPLILGVVFSLLVFVGSYAYVRFTLGEAKPAVDRDFVIEEIARLDEARENDVIPEEYYEETRDRLKRAVRDGSSSTD